MNFKNPKYSFQSRIFSQPVRSGTLIKIKFKQDTPEDQNLHYFIDQKNWSSDLTYFFVLHAWTCDLYCLLFYVKLYILQGHSVLPALQSLEGCRRRKIGQASHQGKESIRSQLIKSIISFSRAGFRSHAKKIASFEITNLSVKVKHFNLSFYFKMLSNFPVMLIRIHRNN